MCRLLMCSVPHLHGVAVWAVTAGFLALNQSWPLAAWVTASGSAWPRARLLLLCRVLLPSHAHEMDLLE